MLIDIDELFKNRIVYIVERATDNPQIIKGTICGVVKNTKENKHYLIVEGVKEKIKVEISGCILPPKIMTNSIWFTEQDAEVCLGDFKEYLRTHIKRSRGGA